MIEKRESGCGYLEVLLLLRIVCAVAEVQLLLRRRAVLLLARLLRIVEFEGLPAEPLAATDQ